MPCGVALNKAADLLLKLLDNFQARARLERGLVAANADLCLRMCR